MNQDLKIITKSDGKQYTIRRDRRRYFYPNEWQQFHKELRNNNKGLFDFLINTGARIDEALHIRPCDFDFDRGNLRLWKTKAKARKGQKKGEGKPRTMPLSTAYLGRVKRLCSKVGAEEYLFKGTKQAANQLLKNVLKRNGIQDYYNFSLHNIRKTHGMWLKAIGVPAEEICLRLGHDYNTYLNHYGSAEVFTVLDIREIERMMDDLYLRKRR